MKEWGGGGSWKPSKEAIYVGFSDTADGESPFEAIYYMDVMMSSFVPRFILIFLCWCLQSDRFCRARRASFYLELQFVVILIEFSQHKSLL